MTTEPESVDLEGSESPSAPLRVLLNQPPEAWPDWARLQWARTFGEHQRNWREQYGEDR